MVSATVFASVMTPTVILILILLILIIGSRNSIKDLKAKQRIQEEKNTELFEQVNAIGVWSMAAQNIGYLPVPESESKKVYDEIYG